ncbi:MarR family winged helix-turn-helix transcriptional regulator [Hasllibacter sp. MH4015]|uniref:MarR family winged helix-turn-helix transcriptional regulator n=1 Tax=Hasllibacter sp. MH4015 TaxID=2854029 RepID=UPI001CD6088B|nr:MarR family transcriptional regulator [Hasllibacter sp. MH4015]
MDMTPLNRAERVARRKARQDANLFSRLSAAAIASRGQAQRLLKASAALSITEWRVLWDLSEAGPLSIQDLASIQRTDHSLISRTLPKMSDKGWVKAIRNSDDKRQSLIELTDAGARAFAAAAPTMKRRRDVLAQAFSPEDLQTLLRLLDRFERVVADPALDPPALETPT